MRCLWRPTRAAEGYHAPRRTRNQTLQGADPRGVCLREAHANKCNEMRQEAWQRLAKNKHGNSERKTSMATLSAKQAWQR
eukprot:358543-Chlamydomonas_euryale.AAC.3